MSTMSHKGYSARVEFDGDDRIFVGRIAGIRDRVGFHGTSVDALETAFREAVDDYIATCEKIGKKPQKAYTGKVMFRIAPDLHRRAAVAADLSGLSLNEWASRVLSEAAQNKVPTPGSAPGKSAG